MPNTSSFAPNNGRVKNDQRQQDIVTEVINDWQRLYTDRANFEAHWREIAERIIPAHRPMFQQKGWLTTKGEKRTEFIFDSTASLGLNRFAAILDSLLTPRNQTWHRLMVDNRNLVKDRQVKLWFDEVNRTLFKYRYAPRANFASQNQQNYKSLGAYGTGSVFIDDLDGEPGIRYKNTHIGEIYFAENHQGIVDRATRYFMLTCRQAIQKWGEEKCPAQVVSSAKQNPLQPYFFIHEVRPRLDIDYKRLDYRGMPWASYYICVDTHSFIDEGGYTTFPYAISRYEQSPGEVYGRSPAMDVLPAIKTLNEEKKTMLKQGHRIVDPVLLAHDDGILDAFSLRPGAINVGGVTSDGRPLVHPLPTGNVQIGKEMMDDERNLINDAFLITVFQILTETPQMTATEVLERTKEKGILLAPTIGRQQSEYLGPLIERELDVLIRQNLIPPMPGQLKEAKGEYRIEYDSPLSRAQRAEEAAGLSRVLEQTIQAVQVTQDPSPLDHFDWDKIVPDIADIQAVPAKWMRAQADIQKIREQRAQQKQIEQAGTMAPGAAAMVKSMAVAKKAGAGQ